MRFFYTEDCSTKAFIGALVVYTQGVLLKWLADQVDGG